MADVTEGSQPTIAESVLLAPTALVELYILNASSLGAGIFYFCNDIYGNGNSVLWQGQPYTPYALAVQGYEFKSQGELPRPHITFSNLFGAFTALNLTYGDLVGAKLVRKRVFFRNLDQGTDPNPNAGWPDDVFFFHQKIRQNKLLVEYELSSILEIENVQLPGRQVFSSLCASLYRSPECSYTGIPVADVDGNPVPVPVKINGAVKTASTWDLDDVPYWNATHIYSIGDTVAVLLSTGFYAIYVAIENDVSGVNAQPPNSTFWFSDDCSRCLDTGCQQRFGKGVLPFAAFPGTESVTSTTSG